VAAGQFFKLEAMMYALDNKTDLNQCFAKRDSGRDESAMEKIFRPSGTEDHGSSRLRRLRKDHCPPRAGNNTDGQHKSDGPPSISGPHLSPIQVIYLPTVAKLDSEWRRQISQRAEGATFSYAAIDPTPLVCIYQLRLKSTRNPAAPPRALASGFGFRVPKLLGCSARERLHFGNPLLLELQRQSVPNARV